MVFDPWKQIAWDRNDTVLLDPLTDPDVAAFFRRLPSADWPLVGNASPTWHKLRNVPTELQKLFPGNTETAKWRRDSEARAAQQTADHAATPTATHFDSLGREFLVVTHNRFTDPRSNSRKEEFAHTRTVFDVEGNRRAVIDALGRTVMAWDFDLIRRPLRETSMDAGRRWMLPDATSQPMRRWDERGHIFRHTYDAVRRPMEEWIIKPADPSMAIASHEICYERFTYGEHPGAPTDANLRGRVWKHNDTAGLITMQGYDAKGNLLASARQFCRDYKSTPDWSGGVVLEDESFVTSTDFDAFNRPIRIITPYAHAGNPRDSQVFPRYGISGQLFAITVNTPNEPFFIVRGIDYNARGQRCAVQFGNNAGGYGLRTLLSYDDKTFRLQALVTVNKDKRGGAVRFQSLDYTYDPIGNVVTIRDTAQEILFFKQQTVKPDADYVYDALYRLISASGREHIGQNLPPNAWDAHRSGTFDSRCNFISFPNPNDPRAMRNYTQRYAYDLVGNIEEMIHQAGPQGSWRRVYGYDLVPGSRDKRSNRLVSSSVASATMRYDYDAHGSMISMPHLPSMETDFRDQLSWTTRQSIRCAPDRPFSQGERTYYAYDSSGERIRKVTEYDGVRVSERCYLGTSEIYRKYAANGRDIEVERRSLHVADGDRRFALFEARILGRDGTDRHLIRSQFPNHLGSASLEVAFDKNAPIISYEEFHPYGSTAYQAVNRSISSAAKRYRYIGKERDEESGLNYHSARYLATWLGRWVSADPSGLKDGPNRYSYARGNPIVFTDPQGRVSWGQVAGISAAVIVGALATGATAGLGSGAAVALVAAVASGALSGAAAAFVEGKVEGRAVTFPEIAVQAGVGAIAGGVGMGLARGASALAATAPVKAAAQFVANSSVGRAAAGALDRIASTAPARAAGRAVQALGKGLQKLETTTTSELTSMTEAPLARSSGGKLAGAKAGQEFEKVVGEALEFPKEKLAEHTTLGKLFPDFRDTEARDLVTEVTTQVKETGKQLGQSGRKELQFAKYREAFDDDRMLITNLEANTGPTPSEFIGRRAPIPDSEFVGPARATFGVIIKISKKVLESDQFRRSLR